MLAHRRFQRGRLQMKIMGLRRGCWLARRRQQFRKRHRLLRLFRRLRGGRKRQRRIELERLDRNLLCRGRCA